MSERTQARPDGWAQTDLDQAVTLNGDADVTHVPDPDEPAPEPASPRRRRRS